MIKSNMMPPKNQKPVKAKPVAKGKAPKKSGSKGSSANILYFLVFCIVGFVGYLELFGIPDELRPYIPPEAVEFLGLGEEVADTKSVSREAAGPKLIAKGTKAGEPSITTNGSVEEIVRTMRPDVYFREKSSTEYRDQSLSNRIPYQKQAFHIMLSTFYNATPDGIGYLDLAYQAPNFYFARAIAMDSRTRTAYMDNLKSRVIDLYVTDSLTARDGNIEFIVYGGIQQPNFNELSSMQLVQRSKINSEILALRSIAMANQVRLAGIEKPIEEQVGNYRRVLLKVTTDADYPSLLNFADALRKSDIAFGIQQFVSRPAGPEKMQSSIEFVMYAALK
ncbi:MAG: hypothetical protein LBH25_08585 [Fibromonadaceae bacterium]|jgi:hypothetical protein|nr:hypothetical protein [Fibromonadaceae bacterium]